MGQSDLIRIYCVHNSDSDGGMYVCLFNEAEVQDFGPFSREGAGEG